MFFNPILTPKMYETRRKHQAEDVARRLPLAQPWGPTIKWEHELNIQASTYKPEGLFKVRPNPRRGAEKLKAAERKLSPTKRFAYCENILPKGAVLHTCYGKKKGTVLFDGDVIIPTLYEQREWGWERDPWMSLTPMEMISLRPGTKRAKGHTVVAGLGLGHQLQEVSRRKQVKKLTLIEHSKELIDWIMPQLDLGMEVEVVVGNVFECLPKLTADVALVDTFPGYGSNHYDRDRLARGCKNIGFIWAWGAADLEESDPYPW